MRFTLNLPEPDKINTLTNMITDPFGSLDKQSNIKFLNYLKKMQQKYDVSGNIFSYNYLEFRNKYLKENIHISHGCWDLKDKTNNYTNYWGPSSKKGCSKYNITILIIFIGFMIAILLNK